MREEDYDDQEYYEDDEEGSSKGGLLITVAAAAVSAAIAGGTVWYLSPDIKPYEQAIAQFEEELRNNQTTLQQSLNDQEKLIEINEGLAVQTKKMDAAIQSLHAQSTDYANTIAEMQKTQKAMDSALTAKNAEIMTVRAQLDEITSKSAAAEARITELTLQQAEELALRDATADKAQKKREALERQIAYLQVQLKELEEAKSLADEEISATRNRLSESMADIAVLTQDKKALRLSSNQNKSDFEEKNAVLNQMLDVLKHQVSELREKTSELELQRSKLLNKATSTEERIVVLKEQYEAELKAEQSSKNELVGQLNSVSSEKDRIEAELRAMLKGEADKVLNLSALLQDQANKNAELGEENRQLTLDKQELTEIAAAARAAEKEAQRITAETEQAMIELRAQTDAELEAAKVEVENYKAISIKRTNNKFGFEAQLQNQLIDEMMYEGEEK